MGSVPHQSPSNEARLSWRVCTLVDHPYGSEILPAHYKAVGKRAKPKSAPRRRGRLHALLLQGMQALKARGSGLAWLYGRIPFTWRLALRRRVHAIVGTPVPPLLPNDWNRVTGSAPAAVRPIRHGLNLFGYARGEFGLGEALRTYARSLECLEYPFSVFNFEVGSASRQQDHSLDRHISRRPRFATNAFFINADQMPIARRLLGRAAFDSHHNIGFWFWELEKFPRDWHCAFRLVDEIWAPTAFVRDALAAAASKPVLRMPMAVEPDAPIGMDRAHFGLADDNFVFLFSFDFNGFVSRKNPEAVIAAFRQAFPNGDQDVRLLLKSSNGTRFPDRLEEIRQSIANDPRIELRDGFLSRNEMLGLENAVDCFVSLHRAEGFGLGLAECMYFGKPVIGTRYSGNLDFMDGDNSLLVDCRMIPLRNGDYPYWQGQKWADPDVAHAANLMRQLHGDRNFARRLGGAAAASIRRSNSRASSAAAVAARLREIEETLH